MRHPSRGVTTPAAIAVVVVIVIAASAGYFYATSNTSATQQSGQGSSQPTEWKAFSARTLKVGCCPGYVAFDPKNGLIYVTVQPANAVYVVNPTDDAIIANVSVGSYPRDVLADPTNGMVYVVNQGSDSVSVIDSSTNKVVTTIQVGRSPVEIAGDPKTGILYVPAELSHELSVIDGSMNEVVAEISVGCNGPCGNGSAGVPDSVGVNQDTNMIYVAASGVNSLYAVNGSTNEVVDSVPVGTYPDGVTVDSVANMIYVSNLLNNTVSIVNASRMAVVGTLKVGSQPADLAYDAALGDIFVVTQGNNTVSVIGALTKSLVGSVRVGPDYCLSCGVGPVGGLGVDAGSGDVYVAVPGTGNVTVISKCITSSCSVVSQATPPCGSYGVIWTYPNASPVLAGSRVSSAITTCTRGTGSWRLSNQDSNVTVASGGFSCPCADTILFNLTAGIAPLTNGTFWFQERFNGGGFGASFVVGSSLNT